METKRESIRKYRNTLLNKTQKNKKILGSKIYQTENLSKRLTKSTNLLSRLTKFMNYLKTFIYEFNKVNSIKKGDYDAFASILSLQLLEVNTEYKDFFRKHFKISDKKEKEYSYNLLFSEKLIESEPELYLTNYLGFIKYLIKKYKSSENSYEFDVFNKKLMESIRLCLINNKKLLDIAENAKNSSSSSSSSNTNKNYNPFNGLTNNTKNAFNPFNALNNINIKKLNKNPFNDFAPEVSEKLSNMINNAL